MKIKKKFQGIIDQMGRILNTKSNSQVDTYSADYINNMCKVLWTNASPTSTFVGQTVTLNDSISNYKYYEIIFRQNTSIARIRSTGKIPSYSLTEIQDSGVTNKRRTVTALSLTSITFSGGMCYATYGSGTDTANNDVIIPYQILGYK